MRVINVLVAILLVIGGLNWGSVGIFNFNVVDYLLEHIYLDRIVYTIVGIAALYALFAWKFVFRSPCKRVD